MWGRGSLVSERRSYFLDAKRNVQCWGLQTQRLAKWGRQKGAPRLSVSKLGKCPNSAISSELAVICGTQLYPTTVHRCLWNCGKVARKWGQATQLCRKHRAVLFQCKDWTAAEHSFSAKGLETRTTLVSLWQLRSSRGQHLCKRG